MNTRALPDDPLEAARVNIEKITTNVTAMKVRTPAVEEGGRR